jgi:hypothetical protein
MWHYSSMASQKKTSKKAGGSGFVLGRERFEKISAVEGIELSGAMKKRIRDSDREGLSARSPPRSYHPRAQQGLSTAPRWLYLTMRHR